MADTATQPSEITIHPDVVIRPIDLEKDAEALVRMWNESDPAWPGSWSDGIPWTVEDVRDFESEHNMLVVYVAEVDGEIAGYCSFLEGHHGEKNEGYLALLNVDPKYHSRSIGRRLIQETIKRSVREGWKRQTLGTWSANFKAVPAYKKTGHFWTPDTSVWMQDFVPGALQMPLAKPFFDRHDWYSCYVREVVQEWDDERWEGLKVFTQHWEAAGEALTIWIDREARAPVAIETDQVLVAAIARDIEPLAGSKVDLTWRVVNKSDHPLQVYLHALGDKGLSIDHREAYTVPAGQTVERTATVEVAGDASPKKDDGTAPAVRSILRVGDGEVELFSGMRARKPLQLDTAPEHVTVRPGQEATVRLQLHSELPEPATVALRLTPPDGLEVGWTFQQVQVPAKGHLAVPLVVRAAGEAAYDLPVRLERLTDTFSNNGAPAPKAASESVTIYSLAPGGMLVKRSGANVGIETDTFRVSAAAKEARVRIEHKAGEFAILALEALLGPPFYPSDLVQKEHHLEHEVRDGRAVVRFSVENEKVPGLWFLQEFTFSPTGHGSLSAWLENRGPEAQSRRVRMNLRGPDRETIEVTLPLTGGLVRCPGGQYPVGSKDAPREPAAYAEPWSAWETRGVVALIRWDGQTERIDHGWHSSVSSRMLTVAPGECSPRVRMDLYVGEGSWLEARRALLGAQDAPALEPLPPTRPALQARLEPDLIVTDADDTIARLVVDSTSLHVEHVTAQVQASDGLRVTPEAASVGAIVRGQPVSQDVRLALPPAQLGAYRGSVRLSSTLYAGEEPFTVLRPGTRHPVTVVEAEREGQAIWRVENGANSFEVAPGFGPSMISWTLDGENQLFSPFPAPSGFSWAYPFFGGVNPQIVPAGMWGLECHLHRERMSAAPARSVDVHGLAWQGVRLSATLEKKQLQGLAVEIDYLTLGEAPLVKVTYRVTNLRPTSHRVYVGLQVAARLGGAPIDLAGRTETVSRGQTSWGTFISHQPWAALVNPATGRTLLMLGRRPDVVLMDMGQHGRVVGAEGEVRLAGDETEERTYYLALAASLAEAQAYLPLAQL